MTVLSDSLVISLRRAIHARRVELAFRHYHADRSLVELERSLTEAGAAELTRKARKWRKRK